MGRVSGLTTAFSWEVVQSAGKPEPAVVFAVEGFAVDLGAVWVWFWVWFWVGGWLAVEMPVLPAVAVLTAAVVLPAVTAADGWGEVPSQALSPRSAKAARATARTVLAFGEVWFVMARSLSRAWRGAMGVGRGFAGAGTVSRSMSCGFGPGMGCRSGMGGNCVGSGAGDFAAVLGALKERSGLSYGVLAKRLHVGTSTLHRYVQGESVPPEYATIEKFARLTGATPAEMAKLYQLWMAAVEAREAGTSAGRSSPVAEVVPDAEDASIANDTAIAEDSFIAVPPVAAQTTRRRLLPAFAVVAVLGVGATITGVAVASGGSSLRSASGPLPSTAAMPSAASITPPTATPSPIPSSTPSVAAPISVDIRPYQWEDKCDQWYLLNRKPTEVPPPPVVQDARGWATALGAVPAGTMKVELAVQETSAGNTVVLHALHIRTVSKAAPLPWSAFSMASGCGGGIVPVSFDVNLDADRPLAHPTAGQQGDTVIPAVDFPFSVSKADPQVLTVYAHAQAANVSWYLELDWSSGDRSGTVRIDDHGKPFQISGAKGRPLYDYDINSNSWLPDDTAQVN